MNIRLQLYCILLLVIYFDCLFEDWSVVCLLYFMLCLLDTLFYFFPEIIVRLIFLDIIKPLSYIIFAKVCMLLWVLPIGCNEFSNILTWLWIVSSFSFPLIICSFWKLVSFFQLWAIYWFLYITKIQKHFIFNIQKILSLF